MSLYSRLDRIAADVEKLNRQVTAVANSPQAQRTSIEAGTMDINDEDGNLISSVGFQEDGSGAVRFFDGPVPPVPSGVTASADGPIIQATWDGTFVDGQEATYDLAYLEVAATLVADGSNVSFATITAKEGASASVVADVTGDWVVAVRSVSQAGKKSEFATAGTVEVKLTDVAGAIEDAQQSANGKNNVTYSESPPTEADEGIVGDTWFVGATDSESGSWNVVAQYQYTAEGWTQVELSHEVIATVDLGKATVGELDGIRIAARTITGDLFSGDAFDGVVFRGNTFVTRDGNGEFSDRGLFFQKPDGTAIFRVPTDGTPISMSAADVQIERAQVDEVELNVGRVRSGGLFELASGVTPPASPPELNSEWARLATLEPSSGRNYPPHAWENLGYWANGNAWVRTVNIYGATSSEPDKIELFDYTTGAFIRAFNIGLNPTGGVTVLGDTVYVLGDVYSSSGVKSKRVKFYNLATGALVGEWEFVNFFAKDQAKVALGNDGTNLVAAGVAPNLSLNVFRYNPSTGAQVGSQWSTAQDWPSSGGKELYGVRVSGNEVEVVTSWGGRVYLNSNNALVRKTDTANESGYAGWVLPAHDASGCVWVAGVPYPVDSSGTVYEGAPPVSDSTMRLCYTWWDGTHETTPSPIATALAPAWQNFYCSLPVRAGLSKRVYVEFSAAPGVWYRTTVGEASTVVSYWNFTEGQQPLPTTNTFPNADPAVFRSANGNVVVRGDGSGKWGPLTFNSDGTMTSTQIPAWVPVTTFASGFGPQSWGFAPAYRVWPDGKVEWRGIVAGSAMASGQVEPFTIPVEARPPQFVQFAAASTTGANVKRVEFRPPVVTDGGPTNVVRVYHGGVNGSWVSLDGIFYYLT